MRSIICFLTIAVMISCSACQWAVKTAYGIKKPRPENNEAVIQYANQHHVDYDYILRPSADSNCFPLNRAFRGLGANGIHVYSKEGELLYNTNDTACHMNVRAALTKALRSGARPNLLMTPSNIRKAVTERATCLTCTNGKGLFEQPLRDYLLVFGYAKFIPMKGVLTDVDYIDEIKKAGLRDKVSIILLNTDPLSDQ